MNQHIAIDPCVSVFSEIGVCVFPANLQQRFCFLDVHKFVPGNYITVHWQVLSFLNRFYGDLVD